MLFVWGLKNLQTNNVVLITVFFSLNLETFFVLALKIVHLVMFRNLTVKTICLLTFYLAVGTMICINVFLDIWNRILIDFVYFS